MSPELAAKLQRDPLKLAKLMWPDSNFFREQRQMIYSVKDNIETVVPAANQMGKDYTAGAIAVMFFYFPQAFFPIDYVRAIEAQRTQRNQHPHTIRVVSTSVAEHHLKVLWGEIGRWITTSAVPLTADNGGPFLVNYQEVRLAREGEVKNPLNYLVGRVSARGEGLAGHHAAYTLAIIDEASGVSDQSYTQMCTWSKRRLIFGNCNPPDTGCTFFFQAVRGGDLLATS